MTIKESMAHAGREGKKAEKGEEAFKCCRGAEV